MKLNKRLWVLLAVILAVFHVFAFVIPFAHTAVFWIAYACTLLMFAGLSFVASRIFKKNTKVESIILGWPILRVACIASILQIITFFKFGIFAERCPLWLVAIVEVVILAAAFVCLLFKDTVEEVVQQSEQGMQDYTQTMKRLRAQAKALAKNNSISELHPILEKLSDALCYADPVSSKATIEIEKRIADKLAEIDLAEDADSCKALISAAINLVAQRTEICKSGKASA